MITKPTKYTEEYVLNEVQEFWQKVKSDTSLMFWQDLVRNKEYSRERIWEWSKNGDWVEISNIIQKIKEEFETRLLKAGLLNKINPGLTKFVLINHYGMTDKTEIKTVKVGKDFEEEQYQ